MTVYDRNEKITCFYTDIVLVDVVSFSKLSSEQQVTAAIIINGELEKWTNLSSSFSALESTEVVAGFVPTGDGFYVVLQPPMTGYGLSLAISLRAALLNASERSEDAGTGTLYQGIRVASHYGEVCKFSDVTDKINFVGHGMNECARILGVKPSNAPESFLADNNFIVTSESSLAAHDALYASESAAGYFESLGLKRTRRQIVTDKHGFEHPYHFIEFSRRIAFNPPKPADYEERVNQRLEKYRDTRYRS